MPIWQKGQGDGQLTDINGTGGMFRVSGFQGGGGWSGGWFSCLDEGGELQMMILNVGH